MTEEFEASCFGNFYRQGVLAFLLENTHFVYTMVQDMTATRAAVSVSGKEGYFFLCGGGSLKPSYSFSVAEP